MRKLEKLWSIDEACLFDDLAELQGKVEKVDETATVCDVNKAAGGYGVQSYISGYGSAAGAVPVAGPRFLSSVFLPFLTLTSVLHYKDRSKTNKQTNSKHDSLWS